jgi:hypothetical protein
MLFLYIITNTTVDKKNNIFKYFMKIEKTLLEVKFEIKDNFLIYL